MRIKESELNQKILKLLYALREDSLKGKKLPTVESTRKDYQMGVNIIKFLFENCARKTGDTYTYIGPLPNISTAAGLYKKYKKGLKYVSKAALSAQPDTCPPPAQKQENSPDTKPKSTKTVTVKSYLFGLFKITSTTYSPVK